MFGLKNLTKKSGLGIMSLLFVVVLVTAACSSGSDNPASGSTTTPSGVEDDVNLPPTADFSFAPPTVPIGDDFQTVVTFDATGSDPEGDQLSYEWFFQGGRPAAATGRVATTTFPGARPYEVTLTVSDGLGREFTVRKVVPLG